MLIRRIATSTILLLLIACIAFSQTQPPIAFWRQIIKGPLSGPDGNQKFLDLYERALLPGQAGPPKFAPYLEGAVVSVVSTAGTQRILLSMEGNGVASAALLFDGRRWNLTAEPETGTMVRFEGAPVAFTQDPFMITFEPRWVDGLAIKTRESNRPPSGYAQPRP